MKKFFFGVIAGMMLFVLLIVGGLYALGRSFQSNAQVIEGDQLLVLGWSGVLPGHRIDAFDADFKTPITLSHLREALNRAAAADEIKGVLIESDLQLPREYLHELQPCFEALRDAGKPVLAHLELAYGRGLLLASLADRLSLSPSAAGGVYYSGPALHRTYMQEALEKAGVEVHVIHEGEAKGFGEAYAANEMSPAVRQNLGTLVSDLLDLEIGWLAKHRDIEKDLLRRELLRADRLGLSPAEALELGLVDQLETRGDWLVAVEAQFPDAERLALSDWMDSIGRRSFPGQVPKSESADHVAVLWAEGGIVPGGEQKGRVKIATRELVDQIAELREADAVKGVVLRVESPGGSALASEELYQELLKLAADKPLWVSAGPVAASGGYYLALPGEQLWLSPYTVAGSIGVVALLPEFAGTTDKLGLHPQSITHTPMAELSTFGAEVPPAIIAMLRGRMGEVYREFRDRVETHRPVDPAEYLDYAEGRVFAGSRARQLGLADALGNLDDCIAAFKLEKGLDGLKAVNYPRQESLFDLLLKGAIKPRDLLPGAGLERTDLLQAARSLLDPSATELDSEIPGLLKAEWGWTVE